MSVTLAVTLLMRMSFLVLIFVGALLAPSQAADSTKKAPLAAEPARKGYQSISVEQFEKLRQASTNVVLDVRTRKEYTEGHIPGAVLIDFNSPNFAKELEKLDKNKTYLVHCAVGGRSARACKKMDELNFKSVYNLQGGMTAWEKAGKAVER